MKDFKKYYTIQATPQEVYLALTFTPTIMLWSGDVAEMSTEPGSEFSLWDGSIVGKNIEFVEGKKIIQQWYFDEDSENSIVSITLHESGKNTSVELIHVNIPDDAYDDIVRGWNKSYFGALQDFYSE